MKRPWTVFVLDVGPTATFATEDRARQRASEWTSTEYVAAVVTATGSDFGRRSTFRHGVEVRREVFADGAWHVDRRVR